jgi:antirestriction protein ArdC
MPVRANGQRYRGINSLWLWIVADERGYASNRWMTYRQAQAAGAQVRKGEKSSVAIFYKQLPAGSAQTNEDDAEEPGQGTRRVLKSYHVFNCDQIDNLPKRYIPTPIKPLAPSVHQAKIDAFIAAAGADIRYGGGRAFYAPSEDYIALPPVERFLSYQHYGATAAHELAHWTGHKSRLDRDLTGRFKSEAYAMEELIAELAAATIGAELQVPVEHLDDHASYIASWIKVLENDDRALFTAAAKAEAAAEYLLARAGIQRDLKVEDGEEAEPELLAA